MAVAALGLFALQQILAAPVDAAVITRTYDFTVNNVHDQTRNNVPAPINPVFGSFTVTFDPALGTIVNQTSGITVNSLNVTIASPIAFSYNAANTDEVQIGGLDQGTGGLTDGVSDFLLDIFDASGPQPFFGNMDYTIFATTIATGQFSDFAADTRADGTVTVVPTLAVTEPPMLVLFVVGGLLSVAVNRGRSPAGVQRALQHPRRRHPVYHGSTLAPAEASLTREETVGR
jgi:hypothetical protein